MAQPAERPDPALGTKPGPERPSGRPEQGGGAPRPVVLLTVLLATAGVAAALASTAIGGSGVDLPAVALVGLLGALCVAGCLQIRFSHRDHLDALDLFDAVLAVVIFALSGPGVVGLTLIAKGASQAALRVKPLKACFNVAQWMAAAGGGSLCYQRLRVGHEFSPRNVAALGAAMVLVAVVNHLAVVTVLAMVSPHSSRGVFRELAPALEYRWLTGVAVNLAFGLLLVSALHGGAWTTALFFVPLAMLHWANRGYAEGRADRARLAGLQRATHALAGPIDPLDGVGDFLAEVRSSFEVEVAEVVVVTELGYRVHRVSKSPTDSRVRTEGPDWDGVPVALLDHGKAIRASAAAGGPLGDRLRAEGWRDCLAAPLTTAGEVKGLLCTYDRTGLEGFEAGEEAVLEALAGELSGALEKALLVEEVLHQALHDALTGLPNRALFQQRLQHAIGGAELSRSGVTGETTGGRVAVMLVDLDRFKEINDTLGHHSGDLLLKEMSNRLEASLRPTDTVARLGGDEFAIVVPVADPAGAIEVAERLLAVLVEPFSIGPLTLDVGASIGIAVWPEHGDDPATLLQRADVAMYSAKAAHGGYALYSPDHDPYSTTRLALGRELRCAVGTDALAVHYQPKTDLRTGRIIGVEALMRWQHPEHGFVPPDEFIPLAERTGTIRPLTRFALTEALRQSGVWRRRGFDLEVAVNLSARSLLDPELTDDVARLLTVFDVAPHSLTLEITETTVMVDSVRSLASLNRLRGLGVVLSIDDFGTGHSSLAYLKRLPVDEVKIDKSFVMHMASDANDAVIVRSTIELGHNLGLRVVAEGVEDALSCDRLLQLGCDVAQGYFLGRPMPAAQLDLLLADRARRADLALL